MSIRRNKEPLFHAQPVRGDPMMPTKELGRPRDSNIYMPKFVPKGWRILRLTEPVEEGDFYWSKSSSCWLKLERLDIEFPRFLPVIRRCHAETLSL
jgi:hypothetical protein